MQAADIVPFRVLFVVHLSQQRWVPIVEPGNNWLSKARIAGELGDQVVIQPDLVAGNIRHVFGFRPSNMKLHSHAVGVSRGAVDR
ncbi:hypothetical protein D3C81_858470 [compost metagenome]